MFWEAPLEANVFAGRGLSAFAWGVCGGGVACRFLRAPARAVESGLPSSA